jgi:hypothetical protein
MRRFLFVLLAVVAALPLLAACGGDDSSGFGTKNDKTSGLTGPIPAADRKTINAVPAGADYYVGQNNFVVGVTNKDDIPQGGAQVKVIFYDLRDPNNQKAVATVDAVQSAPGVGKVVQHTHADGEVHQHGGQDDGRVGYYAPMKFDHAGFWGARVQARLKDGTTGEDNFGFQVFEKPHLPAPGQAALKSDNLTKNDVTKISEIDSGDPPNDLHDVKIKDAIAAHRPLVIVFSTPAYCTSRFCGPVTEEVENMHDKYKDSVDFVHIEIWRHFDKQELNPTTKEWLVQSDGSLTEPIVFVVDKNGIIYNRWEGPAAGNIMEPSVLAVSQGKTFAQ